MEKWWKVPANREKMTRRRNGQYEAIIDAGEKECSRCHTIKPLAEFSTGRKRKDGRARYAYCKVCHYAYQRTQKLIHEFNITPEEYAQIIQFQNGVCAICGNSPKPGKALSVDHCHITGLLRGGLCWLCNRLLGIFRDDPARLRKAIAYLEYPPATIALGAPRFTALGRVGTKKRRKACAKFQGARFQSPE